PFPKNLENGVLHGSDLVSGEPLSRATSDLLAGLSKQEGDAILNAVHNACHASILYRCSLYTRSLASAFREPACQRRARRWEGPEELLLTIGRRPRELMSASGPKPVVLRSISASSPKPDICALMSNTPFCNGLDEAILDQAGLELLATCC